MTRSPQDPSAGRKSMQTGPSESQSTAWTPAAPAYSSPTAGRPATLSPDTARVADTHARTSRFLRKSRSKQQLRSTAESNGTKHDEGLPASSSSSMHDSNGSLPSPSLPPQSPKIIPASPIRQQARSSTFSSPLSGGGGNSQHASYSPQKPMGSQTGRSVGGWFSSMLASSQTTQESQSNNDDASSIRSYATTATSPSRFLQRKSARDSPGRRSTLVHGTNGYAGSQSGSTSTGQSARPAIAKMGGFDRMFDRAVQFFTDSDSNADKCSDDIWLLGVRHQGWRPEEELLVQGHSRSPSARPSMDTINSESYFHVGDTGNNLPRPSSTRQLAMSARRRLSKSSNKTMSSTDASSPSSLELPLSPPRAKSSGLFKSRKGSIADSGSSSHFLERTTSGSSSSSSAARSDLGGSRYSGTPAVVEEASGTPSPVDDSASMYTFSGETHTSKSGQIGQPAISATQTYGWPPAFYHDFYSRIQLTYRSGFSPLPSASPASPVNSVANAFSSMMTNLNASIGRSMSIGNLGDTQLASGLSSDAGWGCMLRTGQSLLANALMDVHLGRDFRRPLPQSLFDSNSSPSFFSSTPEYSRYARLVSWFFDDPSPLSPFSIHKFATEGKKLGKQIGEWFGPSTAAGAIKVLANEYAPANLGVALAIDTTVYGSEVFHVARGDGVSGWNRPVLILVPLRLGLNGVNPIYYNGLQHYFTLPQCVGIAGGRPSSSYYFVGAQANQLFYIDPHHTKPSVKSVNVPEHLQRKAQQEPLTRQGTIESPSSDKADLDELSLFFAKAYGPKDLESFHCEKVRKMSLAALDPSMLVGLLCQSREDWEDLCRRMREFLSSKEHQHIINIVNEMPAWMRKSSRTISGAGLNASSSSSKPAAQAAFTATSPKASETLKERPGDDIEGSSVEYADSDDWDIDDSDDEDNKSEASDRPDDLGDASIILKPSSPSFQELHPGSFESDEPDYRASRNGRSPTEGKMQDLPPPAVVSTPRSVAVSEDFEKVNIDAKGDESSAAQITSQVADTVSMNQPLAAIPLISPPLPEKQTTSLAVDEKEAGWEVYDRRSRQ